MQIDVSILYSHKRELNEQRPQGDQIEFVAYNTTMTFAHKQVLVSHLKDISIKTQQPEQISNLAARADIKRGLPDMGPPERSNVVANDIRCSRSLTLRGALVVAQFTVEQLDLLVRICSETPNINIVDHIFLNLQTC